MIFQTCNRLKTIIKQIRLMIDIIPAVVVAILGVFLVQFLKSSSGALITCVLFYIVIRILSLFIAGLNNAIFTSYLNWYSVWYVSGIHLLRTINTFFMILSYGIIFFTVGYYLFDKKEL
jgi:ABC-2 type transport system permease protein